MALGAGHRSVLGQVMSESMALACAGVVAGVIAALVTGRFVEQLLFGVTVWDSASILVATGVLLTVSAVAAYVPARRASRIDPMVALRYE
jgi:ABC-type antimicrobial peptide transport system permease subunit